MGKVIAWIVIVVIIVWGIFAFTGKDSAEVVVPEDTSAAVGEVMDGEEAMDSETASDEAMMEGEDTEKTE